MMLPTYAVALAACLTSVYAAPLSRRQATNITDLDVLQFALTLEHLENVFYKTALSQFNEDAFTAAGFSSDYFNNLKFIAHDEEAHVLLLENAISTAGGTPVAACTYNFPFTDVKSFVALGSILEGVGVSAYLGGAPVISSKDILTAAAAILVSEGLHQSIQRDSLAEVSSANIVGTPVSPNAIFTLASAFIASCPSTNPPLPFTAFPMLMATQGMPNAPNITTTFTVGGAVPDPFFITFVSGIETISVPGTNANGMLTATIPAEAQGQTYAFVTSSSATGTLTDSSVLFGPAILEVTPDAPSIDFSVQ